MNIQNGRLLFYCIKRFLQIIEDIVDVLGTDGKTDGVWLDSLLQPVPPQCTAHVRGGCRMDDQGFYIGYISQQGEQL